MKLHYAAQTDVGQQRDHNEDFFAIVEDQQLFIVADGMGGHAAGEVAARIAAEELAGFYYRSRRPEVEWPFAPEAGKSRVEQRLACGVRLANLRIFTEANLPGAGKKGMGTTVVAAAVVGPDLHLVHVGDSRAYRIRDGRIEQLTRDHSLLEEMKEINPGMTEAQRRDFPYKNVITRALGMQQDVKVDLRKEALAPGDRVLLCSDGLSGMIGDAVILAIVLEEGSLEDHIGKLIAKANRAGGIDNVTALMVEVG